MNYIIKNTDKYADIEAILPERTVFAPILSRLRQKGLSCGLFHGSVSPERFPAYGMSPFADLWRMPAAIAKAV